MNNSTEDRKKLEKLFVQARDKWLELGDIKALCDKFNLADTQIRRVIMGQTKNQMVLNAWLELLKERKGQYEDNMDKTNQLLSKEK